MVVFKAKQSFLMMQYSVITKSPLYLYKAEHGPHTLSELWISWFFYNLEGFWWLPKETY